MANELPMPPDVLQTGVTQDFETRVLQDNAYASAGVIPDPPDISQDDDGVSRTPDQYYAQAQGKTLNGFAEYLGAQWEIGKQDVSEGILFSTAAAGIKTYEEVEQEVEAASTWGVGSKEARRLDAASKLFESEHFWVPPDSTIKNTPEWRNRSAKWIANFVQGIPGSVMRSMAFTGAVLGGGGAAASVTGGAGFGVGAFNIAGQIMTGMSYRDLRKLKVPHERAQKLAIASGIIQAAIENLQVGHLLRLGKNAYKNAIRSDAARASIRGTVLRFAWDNNIQATEEYLQEWTQVTAEFLGKIGDRYRLPTRSEWRDAVKRTNEAYVGGLQGAIGQTAGSKAIGGSLGGAARVFDKLNGKPPEDIDMGKALIAEVQYEQNQQRPSNPLTGSVEENVVASEPAPASPKESESTQFAKEQLDVATELRIKASQHLETVQYEIEQLKDQGEAVPVGLSEKLTKAHRDLKDAQNRVKKAKLKVAKSEAQDVIDNKKSDAQAKEMAIKELQAVEDKRTQLYATIKQEKREQVETDLKAQIALLEEEFQKSPVHDAEAVHNISKALHQAELKLMLLQSGLLSKQLENSLIDAERNSIIRKGVGDLAFTAFVRAWNIARNSTAIAKEAALQNRKLIADIVKNSGLTTAEQGQFLAYIKNGTLTQTTLDKLTRRIEALIQKRDLKEARADLNDLLKRATVEKVAPNKASVSLAQQTILSGYANMAKLNENQILERLDALEKELEDEDRDTEYEPGSLTPFQERIIAHDVLGVINKNATAEDVNALYDKINDIYQKGKLEAFEAHEKAKEKAKALVVRARAIVRGRRYKRKLNDLNAFMRSIVLTKRLGITRGLFNIWHTHVAVLAQHADDADYEYFNNLLSVDKEGRERRANTSRFIGKMFDHVLIRDGQSKRDMKLHKVIVNGTKKQKRNGFRDPVSDNELIQLYLQTFDDILASRIKATYGISAEKMQTKLEGILSEDQMYIADRLGSFYQEYYKRMNAHHIKVFGYSLRHNKQYSGRAVGVDTGNDNTYTDFLSALESHRSILPSSIKRRTQNLNKLKLVDAFSNGISHIEDMESWRAFSDKTALLETLFNNERFAQDVMDKFGSEYFARVKRAYRRIIGIEDVPRTSLDKYMNTIRGNYAMFMAGNPSQYFKQATGILIYLNYMTPSELISGLEDYLHNFEEANAMLAETDFFHDRKENITPEIKAMLATSQRDTLAQKLQKFLLLPVSQTDAVVNSVGMWAMYTKGLKAGLSKEQAMLEAERAADQSQSSAGEHQKTSFELELGGPGQLLSTLSKQNVQTSNLSTTAWRRAISMPTPKNIMKAFQSSLALHSSQAAFAAAGAGVGIATTLAFPPDDDDEKLDKQLNNAITDFVDNIIFGSHLGLPVIGPLGKMILTNMWNWASPDLHKSAFSPSIAGLDAAEDLANLEAELMRTATAEVPIDAVDVGNLWTDFNSSGALLIPFAQTTNAIRAMIGFNSLIKTLVWLNTDPEYEQEKKDARRDREPLDAPMEPVDVPPEPGELGL